MRDVTINSDESLVSFDVSSLFTNVPIAVADTRTLKEGFHYNITCENFEATPIFARFVLPDLSIDAKAC